LESFELAGKPANIRVTGYVADFRPYLEKTGVMVVPLLSGGGMRVKIVDGWRWGLPIVSTTIGAEGIEYSHGENILIADKPDEIAQSVVSVLTDLKLARSLREKGRDWVEKNYNWMKIYPAWDQVYTGLSRTTLS
jgi:glycosyltransferase involved in cell wall biosynthesis